MIKTFNFHLICKEIKLYTQRCFIIMYDLSVYVDKVSFTSVLFFFISADSLQLITLDQQTVTDVNAIPFQH